MTVVVTHSTPSDSSFSASGAVAWDASHTLAGVGTMAEQDANTVAITGGAINGTTVGNTTPAAGTFTTLIGGKDVANYGQLTGGATTKAVQFQTLGTDTNISMALQPKGTGAIDLAAGSSGVNISNGGTVTAITKTVSTTGVGYTSVPTIALTAPTTAGGIQATAAITVIAWSYPITSGGTGYTVGDVLTAVGGTFTQAFQIQVTTVSSGVVTAFAISLYGNYTITPTNPVTFTGGTGSGFISNLGWAVNIITITNAGSGYVEQPTITFSGGGGSGAAAYATVGSVPKITALAGTGEVWTASGRQLVIGQAASTPTSVWTLYNDSFTRSLLVGSGAAGISSGGTSSLSFFTNSTAQQQFAVAHTASAVNYVQVTGGASGAPGVVTMSAQGSSTDVDIAVTPKGAGVVKFATYTAGIIAQAGYITVKDSGGTVRRLLVG